MPILGRGYCEGPLSRCPIHKLEFSSLRKRELPLFEEPIKLLNLVAVKGDLSDRNKLAPRFTRLIRVEGAR